MSLPTVGCQLIVFGSKYNIEKDTDKILDTLASAGYKAVEGGASDPVAYKRKLDARGLVYGGSHTSPRGLIDPKPVIKYLKAVDARDVCNSGLLDWKQRTLADFKQTIDILNKSGKTLRAEGIHLHYHNHDFEFAKVDGNKTGMDILLDGLDPEACDLCVDVAWVKIGGDDPAGYLAKHNDRIGYLHFKDHDGTTWTELGRGKVDFAAIMKVLPTMRKVRWVMVEQDRSQLDPVESVKISRAYLKDTFGY
jgi:sugar phosphate isomerase/epimerase